MAIAELEGKIQALCNIKDQADIADEMQALKDKSDALTKKIFSSLSDWQISQLARHPQRLYTLDYLDTVFDEFTELHGDRAFSDDKAIIGGLARIEGMPVMFIGQQKGRTTEEKLHHNFGMPRPEGYRKALRLMRMAEKFEIPVVTFVDTPGAYPGIGAEERGQSEAGRAARSARAPGGPARPPGRPAAPGRGRRCAAPDGRARERRRRAATAPAPGHAGDGAPRPRPNGRRGRRCPNHPGPSSPAGPGGCAVA